MIHPIRVLTISGRLFSALLLFLALALPGAAVAGVSAAYTQAGGKQLTIAITVTSPAPSSIILLQQLPAGTRLLSAEPPAMNNDPKKGKAKWLLRDVQPGTLTVRMSLDREVSSDQVSASIRFKPASGGGMTTLPVTGP